MVNVFAWKENESSDLNKKPNQINQGIDSFVVKRKYAFKHCIRLI